MLPLTTRTLALATFLFLPCGAHAATVSVTNTRDAGPGSLRSALTFAAKHPNTLIGFKVPRGALQRGVAMIQPTTELPAIRANGTRIDGSTQTKFGGNTNSGGPEVMLDGGRVGEEADGLVVLAGQCSVQNVIVSGFRFGIVLATQRASNDRISGCYIGTDATGTKPRPNGYGIVIGDGAHNSIIGGLTRPQRNVVSGNYALGLRLSQCKNIKVQGCFVGLDTHGKSKLPNGVNGVQLSNEATGNWIGGPQPGARNILSGNGQGGCVLFGSDVTGNRVQGNTVGLDASGTLALGNGRAGIECNLASSNWLGGPQEGEGNVVGGSRNGIRLIGGALNRVQGNLIGLDASGKVAVHGSVYGVVIDGSAHDNLIGGVEAGARNTISGNDASGVDLAEGAFKNRVQGNTIGLDITGQVAVPNTLDGVLINSNAHDNLIGGTEVAARNVISGNHGVGVSLLSGAYKNQVQGNYIGTTTAGDAMLYNGHYAILLAEGAHDNLVGGSENGTRNILAANSPIVFLTDKGTTGNRVEGNNIGVDATGTHNLLQGWAGVQFSDEATGNSLGGTTPAQGNLISVITEDKAQYIGNSITGNTIQNNTAFNPGEKTAS